MKTSRIISKVIVIVVLAGLLNLASGTFVRALIPSELLYWIGYAAVVAAVINYYERRTKKKAGRAKTETGYVAK
jgi:uncharacterized membrane protein YfcA